MTEYRSVLERAGSNAPRPDLPVERVLRRRDRKHRNQRTRAGVLGIAIAIAVGGLAVSAIRSTPVPADPPSEELGIFAPVVGRYVVGFDSGIYGIDPAGTMLASTRVQLTTEPGTPLGWSSDGTRLLILQRIRGGRVVAERWDTMRLVVLHADGSETLVTESRHWIISATISPDGSHVVFPDLRTLYVADAEGGPAEVLFTTEAGAGTVSAPTFSPDGTEIAFVVGSGDHSHRVWVMDADGSNAHEILANETTMGGGHVTGLAWSPAGDRIAINLDGGTYTFAPDGSGFTEAPSSGWYLSPDGSQFASGPWHPGE